MSYTLSEYSTPEQFAKWDTFVVEHPEGSFAQLSGWANLKQQFEWQSHILVVTKGDNIVAGALMMDRQGLLGKKVSYVPYGPLVSSGEVGALDMILEGLLQESAQSVLLRVEPHLGRQDEQIGSWLSQLDKSRFTASQRYLQPEATLLLDLTKTEEELMAGMRQTTRRYVRQAERAGLQVAEDVSGQRIGEFYAMLQQVNQRRQFGVHTLEYYQKAFAAFAEKLKGQEDSAIAPYLFFVEKEGKVLGAYFVVRAGNKSWELYGGANDEGMKLKANYLLKWQSIVRMKRDGVTAYDQWGVAPLKSVGDRSSETEGYDKSHHLAGVTYFKEGFGGKRVAYVGSYDKVNQPLYYYLARAAKKL